MRDWEESFHRFGEAALLSCAVLLPVAFYFKTYDSAAVKTAVLHWGAIALAAGWAWHALARGRVAVSASSWPALLPALLYGAWYGLSFWLSPHRVAALPLALNGAAMLAAYLACLVAFGGARFAARFSAFCVLAGWVVAGYALLQAAGVDPFIWKGAWGEHRAFSTLANPYMCACFLAFLPPLALSLDADPETPLPLRRAALALLPAATAAAVLTKAPTALIGFACISASYALLVPLSGRSQGALRGAGLALGVAALSLAGGAGLGQFSGGALKRDLLELRLGARGALSIVAKRPLLGAGPGAFGVEYPNFRKPEHIRLEGIGHNSMSDRADSTFMNALAETGVVGAFLWSWLFLGALWTGLSGAAQLRRAGAVSEAAYAAGFSSAAAGALLASQFAATWTYPAPFWFVWALAGLGAGLASLAAKRAPVSAWPFPVSPDVRRALYAPSLLAALFVATGPGAVLKSEVDLNEGIYFAKQKQYDEAVAHFTSIPRGAPAYVLGLYFAGNARLEQDKPAEAVAYYDRLSYYAPDYVLLHAKRAEALAKLDRWDEAVAERRRQAELDPLYVPNLVAWAEAARVAGDLGSARQAVVMALAEAPQDPAVHVQDVANDLFERKLLAGDANRKALERRGSARLPGRRVRGN
jgi:tetratricopeptide (TPR) repeat protein